MTESQIRFLDRQVAAMKYGKNKSKTLAGLVQDGYDVELV